MFNLGILKYAKYISIIAEVVEAVEDVKEVGGEGVEVRPSYKGKKYSILIKRTK